MISSIEIRGLRGIKEGKLDELAPLSILVGPNGSGKSTVLDALLIAASSSTADAIAQAVRRRVGVKRGARWLLWRGGAQNCHLAVRTDEGVTRAWDLRLATENAKDAIIAEMALKKGVSVFARVSWQITDDLVVEKIHNRSGGRFLNLDLGDDADKEPPHEVLEVRLVDAHYYDSETPTHQLYSRAVEQGRGREAKAIVGAALRGVRDIEILTEGDTPVVHLVFDHYSVPAAVAGDGVQMVLRLSLELASRSGGLVLLEEPEVHQHPGTIKQSALAILAAVRRGVQVVLTTHSLELIDALLMQASEEDLKQVAVFRVQLEEGIPKSSRLLGPEAAFARSQIEDDLR